MSCGGGLFFGGELVGEKVSKQFVEAIMKFVGPRIDSLHILKQGGVVWCKFAKISLLAIGSLRLISSLR